MARITQECEARIKESADIVELLGKYIELRRAGTAWKACCPFHAEKTPSFSVNPSRQSFHCFGCGVGGDAVKFLMMFENLSYPDALRRLADTHGIPVIEEEENPEMTRQRRLRSRVIEVNQQASDYYHRLLCRDPRAAHVRDYLKRRQINLEMARAWQLGWAPESFQDFAKLARSQNIQDELLADAYLLGRSQSGLYPVFRDRLMFPIHNLRGEVVGFSGRVMQDDKDPRKYVNTADTVAFHKGELLFGLHKATGPIGKSSMTVVVCEGQIDVIACHEKADIRNAVAGLGTAFTDEHAQMLRKYAKRAILCYDGDRAGIKASEKTYRKLIAAGLEVYQAALPDGEDPDSLICAQGPQALRDAIENACPYLELRCSQEQETLMREPASRANFIDIMAELAAEIPDATRRDISIADLATRLNTGLENLREQVAHLLRQRKSSPRPSRFAAPDRRFGPDEAEYDMGEDSYAPVVPVQLHSTIRGLITLAAGNLEAQQALVDRIEELQSPIQNLAGGMILQRLLEQLPRPHNREDWASFCQCLSPAQAAAIKGIDIAPAALEDPLLHVDQVAARAARDSLQLDIDALRSRILNPRLGAEEKIKILGQITDIQRMLNDALGS